jgi:hypothetical protein
MNQDSNVAIVLFCVFRIETLIKSHMLMSRLLADYHVAKGASGAVYCLFCSSTGICHLKMPSSLLCRVGANFISCYWCPPCCSSFLQCFLLTQRDSLRSKTGVQKWRVGTRVMYHACIFMCKQLVSQKLVIPLPKIQNMGRGRRDWTELTSIMSSVTLWARPVTLAPPHMVHAAQLPPNWEGFTRKRVCGKLGHAKCNIVEQRIRKMFGPKPYKGRYHKGLPWAMVCNRETRYETNNQGGAG